MPGLVTQALLVTTIKGIPYNGKEGVILRWAPAAPLEAYDGRPYSLGMERHPGRKIACPHFYEGGMSLWFAERFLTGIERFVTVLGKCWRRCTMRFPDAGQNEMYTDQC